MSLIHNLNTRFHSIKVELDCTKPNKGDQYAIRWAGLKANRAVLDVPRMPLFSAFCEWMNKPLCTAQFHPEGATPTFRKSRNHMLTYIQRQHEP